MPTGRSWPELRRAPADVRALLAFRASTLSPAARTRTRLGAAGILLLTAAVAVVPAYLPSSPTRAGAALALLPSVALAFLVLAGVSAVAAAGGREVVPRDEAVALPVSGAADHLGALLLAPLNVAWLLQTWVLLGATATGLSTTVATEGPLRLLAAQVPVVAWVLLATALAQVVGWLVEGVRRGPHRRLLPGAGLVALAAGVVVVATGRVATVLDASPTRALLEAVLAAAGGRAATWSAYAAGSLLLVGLLVVGGAAPARWALRRPMRAEQRAESEQRTPRRAPRSDLGALLRLDRASVWRSVPLRRGTLVLAVLPGLVAVAGAVPWRLATVLPGLVAAGAALLFGVNAWCLDARGALWRESLPVSPRAVVVVRTWVLLELLGGAALVTVALVSVRAGLPSPSEAVAVVTCLVVVAVQVAGGAIRWSGRRPFAVDLRSARATPAPPAVMLGYSARLAWTTTLTGLLFGAFAVVGSIGATLLVGLVMLLWSTYRWERAVQAWEDPVARSRVVSTVTG